MLQKQERTGRLVKPIALVGIAFAMMCSWSSGQEFEYLVSENEASITAYTGLGGNIIIPSQLGGFDVTRIDEDAFMRAETISSVTIPDTIRIIERQAFRECHGLTNVFIGDGVVEIQARAFAYCQNLESVTFGNSLLSIGVGAFKLCPKIASISLPDSVVLIADQSFNSCSRLETIKIPDIVTTLGDEVFENCSKLATAELPTSIKAIGYETFSDCVSLTSISIPDSVQTIGQEAFAGCENLKDVIIPDSVINIGDYAFSRCKSVANILIGSGLAHIGEESFRECTNLSSFDVSENNNYFSSSNGVLFTKDMTTLIQYPIGRKGSYSIPNGVINVGLMAFAFCDSIDQIDVPSSVLTIKSAAFSSCQNLTAVRFSANIKHIENSTFDSCIRLRELFFEGPPPTVDSGGGLPELQDLTIYRLPDSGGWKDTFESWPTAVWPPKIDHEDPMFGIFDTQMRLTVSWAGNRQVVVEETSDLVSPKWRQIGQFTLTDGIGYFNDPEWTDQSKRFYRVRQP